MLNANSQRVVETKAALSPHAADLPHAYISYSNLEGSRIEGFHDEPCVICQVNKSLSFILPQGWPLIISTSDYTGQIRSSHI